MKKSALTFLLVTTLLGGLLSACSSNSDNGGNGSAPTSQASPSAEASPSGSASADPEEGSGESPSASESPKPGENAAPSTSDLADAMLKAVEQPKMIDLSAAELKAMYGIDANILADYTVKAPLMNVKTNEIGIFKVKNAKDVATVKKGMEKRAADVQKTFEQYLQDQYEIAKNYKIVTEGDYVLFLISESADDLEKAFLAGFGK